jgi:ATPase subunit of ABC transporter with duplicated ATPase domains
MGAIEVNGVAYAIPGGRTLFHDVSFRVGDGEHTALIGANGTGKTTLLRLIAGELDPSAGSTRIDGRALVMRQFAPADSTTVGDYLFEFAPAALRKARFDVVGAEAQFAEEPSDRNGIRLAEVHQRFGDLGGWDIEVEWDVCSRAALGLPYEPVRDRLVSTLSGGEQKRLVLEYLLRSDADVLILDEPDNFLDVPAKRWLEAALRATAKTILLVSHDRELLAVVADRIVTIEAKGAWVHGGSFAVYRAARDARLERLDEEHRRFQERRDQLEAQVAELRRRSQVTDAFSSRLRATKTKIEQLDRAAPPERPKEQRIEMRLGGDRTGKRAVIIEGLELEGLTDPFDSEIFFGDRVGIIGRNGTGKSHFLRLLAGDSIAHRGSWRLGARVLPGYFRQLHDDQSFGDRNLLELLLDANLSRGEAMATLRRYELHEQWNQPFATLSGGQQARMQILRLETSGATLLLLDEPTDNLDLTSAEALEHALVQFTGTVLMVTHDRWLMRSCDRYLIFGSDCQVTESLRPDYR